MQIEPAVEREPAAMAPWQQLLQHLVSPQTLHQTEAAEEEQHWQRAEAVREGSHQAWGCCLLSEKQKRGCLKADCSCLCCCCCCAGLGELA